MRHVAVIILATVMAFVLLGTSANVYAQPKPKPAPAALPAPAAGTETAQKGDDFALKKEIYYYQSEMLGRRDPFMSLIAARENKKGPEAEAPPLEKYDLSQMKLFAVVLTQKQQFAMIRLPDGKYHTVKKGEKIGIHDGYVSAMTLSTVTVIESIKDYKGRIIKKEVTFRLREEEGE
jgi:Tfp pilus assembly protein PilP